ncbi:MAG: PTS sugar transporter subunit IIA, partial [Candidatus Firestonebacteria bacterium]|nr:PTS sugar transporter subunit IIA [Candidatus Firestonebacteria bacterium]
MKIAEFLSKDCIKLGLVSKTKKDVLGEMVDVLAAAGKIKNKQKVIEALLEREELGSTGIGQGVAIPHGKTDEVSGLISAFGLSREGVSFDTLDGDPVSIFFLLLAPHNASGMHLKSLAKISGLLKDKYFRKALLICRK